MKSSLWKRIFEYTLVVAPLLSLLLMVAPQQPLWGVLGYCAGGLIFLVVCSVSATTPAAKISSSRTATQGLEDVRKSLSTARNLQGHKSEKTLGEINSRIRQLRGDFVQRENEIFKRLHDHAFEFESVKKGVDDIKEDQAVVDKKSRELSSAWEAYQGLTQKMDYDFGETQKIRSIETKMQALEDIVSQTHLLSFNASIEAARAGVAGQGFSVVASEIALLAKSANSVHQGIREEVNLIAQDSRIDEKHRATMKKLERELSRSLDYLKNRQQSSLDFKLCSESMDLFEKDFFSKKLEWLAEADRLTSSVSPKAGLRSREATKASPESKVIPMHGSQRARTLDAHDSTPSVEGNSAPDWDDDRFEDF